VAGVVGEAFVQNLHSVLDYGEGFSGDLLVLLESGVLL
jgi:hypothetical protein